MWLSLFLYILTFFIKKKIVGSNVHACIVRRPIWGMNFGEKIWYVGLDLKRIAVRRETLQDTASSLTRPIPPIKGHQLDTLFWNFAPHFPHSSFDGGLEYPMIVPLFSAFAPSPTFAFPHAPFIS